MLTETRNEKMFRFRKHNNRSPLILRNNIQTDILIGIAAIIFALMLFFLTTLSANGQSLRLEISVEPSQQAFVGTNLYEVTDWSTQYPFTNIFKTARPWVSQDADTGVWGSGGPLDLDPRGNIRSLKPKQHASTVLLFGENTAIYPGEYLFTYEGIGNFQIDGAVQLLSVTHTANINAYELKAGPSTGGIFFRLTSVDPANYPRNFTFSKKEKTQSTSVFTPEFLASLKGYSCIRFMDWGRTNNHKTSFADRALSNDALWSTEKGVPLEVQIDLCNTLQTPGWFCIPHNYTTQDIQNFLKVIAETYKVSKLYLEHSNEVWNAIFTQGTFLETAGIADLLSQGKKQEEINSFEARMLYHAKRTSEIKRLAIDAKIPNVTITTVLGSFIAIPWFSDRMLESLTLKPDALAVGMYVGGGIKPLPEQTTEQITDLCFAEIAPLLTTAKQHKDIATKHGIRLFAYEGGQHLTGESKVFDSVNRGEGMAKVYRELLTQWKTLYPENPSMFMNFTDCGPDSSWGRWGLRTTQKDTKSPKWLAVKEFLPKQTQRVFRTITVPWVKGTQVKVRVVE